MNRKEMEQFIAFAKANGMMSVSVPTALAAYNEYRLSCFS